ncbi:MAG TPA: beta-1,6-N-acetylglucosaminyltransferase [Flavisolibacter sp.]|nr:beta-1,6-N-acetylglucosaminyltransferase [Flavisolibacter sp.]
MEKAYLIMAHKDPHQVYRLVSRLNDGSSEFFIHIDKKVDIAQFHLLNDLGDILQFTDRFDSRWGRLGLIEPFLSGMKAVKNSPKKFDRIILLSGQDYPIKSNDYINRFFETSPHSVFINYFPIPNYEKWPGGDRGGWYRVDKYYFGNKWYQFLCSRSLNLLSTYIPFLRRKIPNGMKPYAGQTWWNLDMYALHYILAYHAKHPEYLKFHKNTFVADELYMQMIIGNSRDEKLLASIQNSEKRFTIWEKPDSAHPKILRKTDLEAIMASDDLFARKFDENIDSEILDLIDSKLLHRKVPMHQPATIATNHYSLSS